MPLLSTTLGVLGICSNSTIKLIMYGYLHIKFSTRRVIVGFNGRDKEVKEASDYRIALELIFTRLGEIGRLQGRILSFSS